MRRLFSRYRLKVYSSGLSAELSGSTNIAMITLTSPEMVTPWAASRPSKPMGNQQRKSVITTLSRRRATVRSATWLEGS